MQCRETCPTFFVVLADFDALVDVLFLKRTSNDDEVVLSQSATSHNSLRNTNLLFERISKLDDGLLLYKALR